MWKGIIKSTREHEGDNRILEKEKAEYGRRRLSHVRRGIIGVDKGILRGWRGIGSQEVRREALESRFVSLL